jgi:type IV pilus assembly protein PilX
MSSHKAIPGRRRQRGAALIIGLLLLLVLTLLAVSGMNSASVELVMAGNEQYQNNAFSASETGVEQALNGNLFNPGSGLVTVADTVMPNTVADTYGYTIASDLGGAGVDLSEPGYGTRYTTYHFQVLSTGLSARNSRAVHTQGNSFTANKDAGEDRPQCGGTAARLDGPGGAGGC